MTVDLFGTIRDVRRYFSRPHALDALYEFRDNRYFAEYQYDQCRINYGSGGSPEPGPLSSGGLIISQAEGADKKGFNWNDFELKCAHS